MLDSCAHPHFGLLITDDVDSSSCATYSCFPGCFVRIRCIFSLSCVSSLRCLLFSAPCWALSILYFSLLYILWALDSLYFATCTCSIQSVVCILIVLKGPCA
ncbi:hypothetical protein BDV93DRAFT_312389 [Ceratobasidium sp. AG-I]|nr:hypothetical protein BDV93DRAFT_312389 [Ceratobasidium sp. AG-I]